ncbi:hypothetical protein DM02DRAFT_678514 [Periconia macrospinosa]|uniref:Uncharacterized protein n=1 Tax=Periconia macrospinosa TaxID=97972 RepID=A0A2V1CZF9_9PLEO|nr:hypothetical protein DM02DRAFT_678514 [Periconia macrospinosa]
MKLSIALSLAFAALVFSDPNVMNQENHALEARQDSCTRAGRPQGCRDSQSRSDPPPPPQDSCTRAGRPRGCRDSQVPGPAGDGRNGRQQPRRKRDAANDDGH